MGFFNYDSSQPRGLLNPDWSNWASSAPTGLTGSLAKQFDPTKLRYAEGSDALIGMGLGLLNPDPKSGNPWMSGLSRGFAGAAQGVQDAQDRFYQQGFNNLKLMDYQREQDQRDTDKTAAQHLIGTLPPELQAKFGDYAKQYPSEFMKAYADAQLKAQYPGTSDRYSGNFYWGQGSDGQYHWFQADKQAGGARQVDLPAGMNPAAPMTYVDTPTDVIGMPTKGIAAPGANGAPVIPKDIAGAERKKVEGKGTGEATNLYRSMKSKMPSLEKVVGELDKLAETATYTGAGRALDEGINQLGLTPRQSAVDRTTYISKVNNQILPMLRDTFGAQFTQVEGERLMATLGDPNTTPQQKQAVLKSFIEQKRRDVESLALQSLDTGEPTVDSATQSRGNVIKYDAQGNRVP